MAKGCLKRVAKVSSEAIGVVSTATDVVKVPVAKAAGVVKAASAIFEAKRARWWCGREARGRLREIAAEASVAKVSIPEARPEARLRELATEGCCGRRGGRHGERWRKRRGGRIAEAVAKVSVAKPTAVEAKLLLLHGNGRQLRLRGRRFNGARLCG